MSVAAAPDRERLEPTTADTLAGRTAQADDAHDRWACGRSADDAARAADDCRDIRPELIIELI